MTLPIISPAGFYAVLSLFAAGAIGSLLFTGSSERANRCGAGFAVIGALWGLCFSVLAILSKKPLSFSFEAGPFPLFRPSFHIDMTSAFFIFVISLVTLLSSVYGFSYVKHYYKKFSIGALGFFYNVFVLGMLVVVTADNALWFLVAWEIMSLSSYFLVIYERDKPENIKAGFLYLVMTHVATAFIVLAFLLLHASTGSFDFGALRAGAGLIPRSIKNAVFILAMVGFGTKAGTVPFHVWLPGAHPAAPAHVSALMSGVMIKMGIYMMIRLFLDLLQPIPVWWGPVVLMAGAVSSLLGVLYALTEHDLKKLLACHSIENIGIILLGVGASMSFLTLGMPALSLLGLVAALYHTLNHATFKSLLFLSAGSVMNATHTGNMEKYGGLIKTMPQTALFFLIGSMAICALPPFNGFFSEWLTFQALFRGIATLDFSIKWVFVAAAGILALTGGLALTCFVKAFGATFLARPRSREAGQAKEAPTAMLAGMGVLAALTLILGILSGPITAIIDNIGRDLGAFRGAPSAFSTSPLGSLAVTGFSWVGAPFFCAVLLGAFAIAWFIARYGINRGRKISVGATWDCGSDLTPRMEITATGFARSIVTVFRGLLKPSLQRETEYHDAQSRYLPAARTITLGVKDIHRLYLYKPLKKTVALASRRAKAIQSGNVNLYIFYIFLALLAALAVVK